MKAQLLFVLIIFLCFDSAAQQVINGPELDNDRSKNMNRMLQGDENSFYTYRIRSKTFGTSYFIEKYDKSTLKPLFSKEVEIDEDLYTKIEDVVYASEMVYIFIRQYDKAKDKMTLYYRTVSSDGVVSGKLEELLNVGSDHYEFVDFDIYPNPSKTKLLVKVSYKANKEDSYKTNFMLYDSKTMKKLSSKQVDQKLFTSKPLLIPFFFTMSFKDSNEFIGLMLDDADNIYYGYSYMDNTSSEKSKVFKLAIGILLAKETTPKTVELGFDDNYYVGDIEFSKTNDNQLVVGGFLKDLIERKGRDLMKVGIFSFTVDILKSVISAKTVKLFDDKILYSLESNPKRAQYFKYKLDYIMPIGKNIYYVGEQYREEEVTTYNYQTSTSETHWDYEYMDVIIAKFNPEGEFEWVKNTPLRIEMSLSSPHVFKQYIAVATADNIYILNDEHPKNLERYSKPDFEPRDLKGMSSIHGTNFVSSKVSIEDGSISHKLLFVNDDYCFAPIQERNFAHMPPSTAENFVYGNTNEIIIYTEDRGRDRFSKINFE